MAKTMPKAMVAATLAEQAGVSKRVSAEWLDALAELAYREARHGFRIPGIGKLVVRKVQARNYVNPRTLQPIRKKAQRRVRFEVSKLANQAILGRKRRT
jgi:DNA-binding protein HU-beta